MRLIRKLELGNITPFELTTRAIEWVVAVCTLVGGLYLFTPLYAISKAATGGGVLSQTLSHPLSITFWGIILLAGAIFAIAGLVTKTPQLKSIGWFSIFLARFFQILTTWLAVGFLPLSWIYPFTITLIVIVLYGLARLETYKNATT